MGKKKAFLDSFRDLLHLYNIDSAAVYYDKTNRRSINSFAIDSKGENIIVPAEELLNYCGFKNLKNEK